MNEIEKAFKALADKNRLRILKLLERKDMCVCELASVINIAQPSVSRHLRKLTQAGLIEAYQKGLWTNYRLNKKSIYSNTLLTCLARWLGNDATVQADKAKAKKVKRNILCK